MFARSRGTSLALCGLLAASLAFADTALPPMPLMQQYVFGVLRKGPKWTADKSPALDSLQAGHMAHLGRMWKEGWLVAAGPVTARNGWRGLLIFRADSASQVRALSEQDPAVRAGRLAVDLWPWFAPQGIGQGYTARTARLGPGSDSMVTRWVTLLRTSPKPSQLKGAALDSMRRGHLAHILGLLASGHARAAGPLTGAGDIEGLTVFVTDSLDAWTRANADPAARSGDLTIELFPWWCAYGVLPGEE
ncbi:MAG: hypothetical protein HOP12_09235 [Candidatus Eisenbacteria bacterium]|uniref:YCII-related domain-containing protein n=1 Tax=Eiseniibacteriota bacterium TaxID=2212470 RepID=A0A849SF25_UNCEI|nr:hypothetical protein [Candidatus Eisenbacteria bacterium]